MPPGLNFISNMADKNNPKEINLIIKRGILDSAKRQLIISPDYIKFEDKNLFSDPYTQFKMDEIAGFRYGVKWISGPYFTFGRDYQVFIKNKIGEIIKINFSTYYGIRKKELHELYKIITNKIWEYYFSETANNLTNRVLNGEEIEIGGVKFTRKGVIIQMSGIINDQPKTIPWDKTGTRFYNFYFAIFSKEDSANINKSYSYLNDWNTAILYVVLEAVLKHKKISNN